MATSSRPGGRPPGRPAEEPFGPADRSPRPAPTRAEREEKARRQAALRTPSDRQVWSQLDDEQHRAYQAGLRGDPPNPEAPDVVRRAHEAGVAERSRGEGAGSPAPARSAPASAARQGAISVADDGAGFLLGLIAYSLTINYLRYGWPGVTGWMSAKFLNKVTVNTGPTKVYFGL